MELNSNSSDSEKNIEEIIMLSKNHPEKIQVIEAQIDVEIQLEFYETASELSDTDEDINIDILINQLNSSSEEKVLKKTIVWLSTIDDVRAFRAIENFVMFCPDSIKAWCMLAYEQSKMMLETSLLKETKVFISSALGGIGNKIRYSVGVLLKEKNEFSSFQKDVIQKEIKYYLGKGSGELEAISYTQHAAFITVLVPLHINIQILFTDIVNEINQYGSFLHQNILITNAKHLQLADLIDI